MLDGALEAAKQALFQRLPFKAEQDALPYVGETVDLERGLNGGLSEDDYRAALSQSFPLHRLWGHRDGLLAALDRAGYPNAYVYEQRSQWDPVVATDAIDVNGHREIGWGRITQQSDWNQYWIVLDIHVAPDWTDADAWVDADTWPSTVALDSFPFVDHFTEARWVDAGAWTDSDLWYEAIPPDEVARVFRIAAKLEPSEARLMGVYWIGVDGAITGHPADDSFFWVDADAWVDSESWPDGYSGNGELISYPTIFIPSP